MDRETLRTELVAGIDRILGHPIFLSAEDKKLLNASKSFWQGDDGTALDKVLALYNSE